VVISALSLGKIIVAEKVNYIHFIFARFHTSPKTFAQNVMVKNVFTELIFKFTASPVFILIQDFTLCGGINFVCFDAQIKQYCTMQSTKKEN
jgi:hypothetical protein